MNRTTLLRLGVAVAATAVVSAAMLVPNRATGQADAGSADKGRLEKVHRSKPGYSQERAYTAPIWYTP